MTFNGHVENGKIVLDQSVPLTEGMKVRVELLSERGSTDQMEQATDDEMSTIYDRHKSWIGIIKDAPSDYARNHDHYLHGQTKK
jgi:hypothetical protein